MLGRREANIKRLIGLETYVRDLIIHECWKGVLAREKRLENGKEHRQEFANFEKTDFNLPVEPGTTETETALKKENGEAPPLVIKEEE